MPVLTDRALLRSGIYIDGDWMHPSVAGIEVTNPATGELIGRVPRAGREEAGAAIRAAEKALPTWAAHG